MIKKWGKEVIDYFFNPSPTFFDLCVCLGIVGISFIRPALRGFYLEFYTIFLIIIGLRYKERRSFNPDSLILMCLLGLIGLFKHSYEFRVGGLSFEYLNFYLQHEGFSYIFFACLLFYIVTTKSKNLRLLIFALPFVAKVWIAKMLFHGQLTPILALGVGIVAYLCYKRQFKWAICVSLYGLNIVAFNYRWALMKFACRPHIWMDLLLRIKDHPFVGSGFNKLVLPDNFLCIKTWGNTWLFRHNDFLSAMAYIGAFAIIPITLFIKELAVRFRGKWFMALLVAFVALCFFQITFIHPDRVAIILLSLAWCYVECDRQK